MPGNAARDRWAVTALALALATLPPAAARAQAPTPLAPAPVPNVPPAPGTAMNPGEEGADQLVGLFAATCLHYPGDAAGLRAFLTGQGAPPMPPRARDAFLVGRAGQVFDTSYNDVRLALISLDDGSCEAVVEHADGRDVLDFLGEAMRDARLDPQSPGRLHRPPPPRHPPDRVAGAGRRAALAGHGRDRAAGAAGLARPAPAAAGRPGRRPRRRRARALSHAGPPRMRPTARLLCSSPDRSARFYAEALGFEDAPVPGAADAGAIAVRLGATTLLLCVDPPGPAPEYPRGRGLTLCLHVPDLEATYAGAAAHGARVLRAPAESPPAGEPWDFELADPDGYALRFVQDVRSAPLPDAVRAPAAPGLLGRLGWSRTGGR